jgi:hypothetical protein
MPARHLLDGLLQFIISQKAEGKEAEKGLGAFADH